MRPGIPGNLENPENPCRKYDTPDLDRRIQNPNNLRIDLLVLNYGGVYVFLCSSQYSFPDSVSQGLPHPGFPGQGKMHSGPKYGEPSPSCQTGESLDRERPERPDPDLTVLPVFSIFWVNCPFLSRGSPVFRRKLGLPPVQGFSSGKYCPGLRKPVRKREWEREFWIFRGLRALCSFLEPRNPVFPDFPGSGQGLPYRRYCPDQRKPAQKRQKCQMS